MSKKKKTIGELLEEALVPEDEQPFQVPENWVWVRTETANGIVTGSTPAKKQSEYYGGGFPFVKPADLEQGSEVIHASEYLTEKGKAVSRIIPKESTMVCCIGSIGKAGFSTVECTTNQQINSLVPNKKMINPKFNYYQVLNGTYQNELWNRSSATTVSIINKGKMSLIPYVLPPFNEQKRIAEKVERLLSKIEEAKQLIEEAKKTFELRRAAILDKAFRGELTRKWREEHPDIENAEVLYDKIISLIKPEKFEIIEEQSEYIPCKWKWVRLGEVVQVNPPKKKLNEVSEEQKCTFIPMPAVSDKTGKIEEPEEREYGKVKKGYTFFLENDVLFAKITPCMENGKSAIARQLKNGFGYGSTEFHVLRTSEYVNEQYIHYLVRSQRFRAEAKREMTGAVGQQRVPKEFLLNYPFPLPPKEEQDAIVNILDDIFAKDNYSKFNLQLESELDILKQCILSKAFRGVLGTNVPSEESAVELLKEVLQEQVK
ncbi:MULTISPECIES: restriction endonuclease subunit S [Bacillus amyloliquefaciens group]|uniref:restriction endonuclease subunit S n=1 Tax=Bacillus amyloliquefaciens group TaxID=1938374 RepID=UPI001CCD2F51|nr:MULTISPECIES: restriction endonuclease subunit S [Bacillus amyloliquefaciens group]MCR6614717.1 restriction endonuclease subunit S [Bacillus amyloliquefaciens]UBM44684.1 restriction endonuclease subunit S [Bacillus velezensis]